MSFSINEFRCSVEEKILEYISLIQEVITFLILVIFLSAKLENDRDMD